MTEEERQFVLSELGESSTQARIAQAAYALTAFRAEQEVRSVLSKQQAAQQRAEQVQAIRHDSVLEPAHGKRVQNWNGEWAYEHPARPVKVMLVDFVAYCKERGLSEAGMRDMLMGQRADFDGYKQGPRTQGCVNGPSFSELAHRAEVDRLNRDMQKDGAVKRNVRLGASPASLGGDLSKYAPIAVSE